MSIVGTPARRVEGDLKVTGRARFTSDLRLSGLTHARLLLSPHAAARITRVDLSAARSAPGVVLAVAGPDLAEVPATGPEAPLARDRVFFAGQPVVAVVAETEAQAEDALALVEVDYELLPAVFDTEQALAPAAPPVLVGHGASLEDAGAHGLVEAGAEEGGVQPVNATSRRRVTQGGDAAAALAASAVVASGRFVLPAVHQGFLETHVATAAWDGEEVTIWTSTQGQFMTRKSVADLVGLPLGQVRVVPMAIGGGFGGKMCLVEPLATLLARMCGRPVRLELTRTEEFLMGRGGPGCVVEVQVGADAGGRLTALSGRVVFDNGAATGGLGGLVSMMIGGTYRIPNVDFEAIDVATNKTPVAAYRAPGAQQAYFALESALDEIARRLGQDPIELRLRNASIEGDPIPGGGTWPRIGLVECLEAARAHPAYTDPRAPGEGVGVAVGGWMGGREPAAAGCRVDPDGILTLMLGTSDISGTDTSLAMIAAETFGVRLDRVRIDHGDTASAPYAGVAGGSKTIYSVGPAVLAAAADARRQLLEIASEELEVAVEDLVVADGEVRVSGVPGRSRQIAQLAGLGQTFGGRHAPIHGHGRAAVREQSPMFTVHVARVRADAETGEWRLTRYAAVQDVGRALNPPEIEGQIHGGAVQSFGRALGEELRWDGQGTLRTASFLDYGLPSIDQVPQIEVALVEVPSPVGPLGARGVGEPPAVPGPAAVANAIADATGVRMRTLPLDFAALSRSPAASS